MVFAFSGITLLAASWYFFQHSISDLARTRTIYYISMSVLMAIFLLMWRVKQFRIELVVIALLTLRIFFNLTIVPDRLIRSPQQQERLAAEKITEITRDKEFRFHHNAPVTEVFSYYVSTGRDEIVEYDYHDLRDGVFYVFDNSDPPREGEKQLMVFETSLGKRELRFSFISKE
jgi:hypothetical protein